MRTKHNLVKHELIGLEARVARAPAGQHVGLTGRVVDETMKLLVFETPKGEKSIPKSDSSFEFIIGGEKVLIEGNRILHRPEERIKKAR